MVMHRSRRGAINDVGASCAVDFWCPLLEVTTGGNNWTTVKFQFSYVFHFRISQMYAQIPCTHMLTCIRSAHRYTQSPLHVAAPTTNGITMAHGPLRNSYFTFLAVSGTVVSGRMLTGAHPSPLRYRHYAYLISTGDRADTPNVIVRLNGRDDGSG